MKKICFITTTSITLKTFVIETAKKLHETGNYDITFICDYDEDFATSLPDYIKYLPVLMKRGISFNGLRAIISLKKIFKKEKFDLIQYSTPNASFYASIAAKVAKIPIRLYCQWGIRYVGMGEFTKCLFKQIEKITCNFSTDIRAVSYKNYDFGVKEGLYKPDKACVLGQGGTIGVDLIDYDIENKEMYNKFIRENYCIGDEFVFGFVGRFSRDKGSNELLKAFKTISNSKSVKLLCIGDLETEIGIDFNLLQWARDSEKVIFTGQIKNSELKKYYSVIDCYVHPTYREGFGMVLQEAAAMGCAIITTDIPGASEVLENGISCLLAKPRDVYSLKGKMSQMIDNIELRKKLGNNARKRVEKYFDRTIMIETQMHDYENILEKREIL